MGVLRALSRAAGMPRKKWSIKAAIEGVRLIRGLDATTRQDNRDISLFPLH